MTATGGTYSHGLELETSIRDISCTNRHNVSTNQEVLPCIVAPTSPTDPNLKEEPSELSTASIRVETTESDDDKAEHHHHETEQVKSRSHCRRITEGEVLYDLDADTKSGFQPIEAIEASLGRWILYLDEHEVSASYTDLLLLHASAKRFMRLVDFFFFTLVDLLMRSSQIFGKPQISIEDGIVFPPTAMLRIEGKETSKGDIAHDHLEFLRRASATSTDQQPSSSREGSTTNDLQVLHDWLLDGVHYLENETVTVYYEDFRKLHDSTKKLVELLDTYFKDLVDKLLERCVDIEG